MRDERPSSEKYDKTTDKHSERPNKEKAQDKQSSRAPIKDITPVLKGWDYESGTINVRKIAGLDGSPKLQMRLDLGLLQMEMTGRPDGVRPHGYESLLDYFEGLLKDHKILNGSDLGFHLTTDQCQALRDEAAQYYQRYLSLFVLGEYVGVVRDTARNIRVLDLCGRFAVEEQDQLILEQYRPYIVMMNARAEASLLYKEKQYPEAMAAVRRGLKQIKSFFARFGQVEAYGKSNEVKVLKKFARDIRRKLPVDPIRKLETQLERAIKDERYEDAARLRDELQARRQSDGKAV